MQKSAYLTNIGFPLLRHFGNAQCRLCSEPALNIVEGTSCAGMTGKNIEQRIKNAEVKRRGNDRKICQHSKKVLLRFKVAIHNAKALQTGPTVVE